MTCAQVLKCLQKWKEKSGRISTKPEADMCAMLLVDIIIKRCKLHQYDPDSMCAELTEGNDSDIQVGYEQHLVETDCKL